MAPGEARRARGAHVAVVAHAAARDDSGARALERERTVEVRAAEHAVAGHIGVDHGGDPFPLRRARPASSARSVDVSVQPRIATMPSRASIPTASRSVPADFTAAGTNAGSIAAAVPTTARAMPSSSASRSRSSVRRPPPSWTPARPPPGGRALGSRRHCRRLRRRDPDPPRESTARPGRRIAPRRRRDRHHKRFAASPRPGSGERRGRCECRWRDRGPGEVPALEGPELVQPAIGLPPRMRARARTAAVALALEVRDAHRGAIGAPFPSSTRRDPGRRRSPGTRSAGAGRWRGRSSRRSRSSGPARPVRPTGSPRAKPRR